jgi:hypothetical protein
LGTSKTTAEIADIANIAPGSSTLHPGSRANTFTTKANPSGWLYSHCHQFSDFYQGGIIVLEHPDSITPLSSNNMKNFRK